MKVRIERPLPHPNGGSGWAGTQWAVIEIADGHPVPQGAQVVPEETPLSGFQRVEEAQN